MPFTPGSIFGRFNGATLPFAFGSSNPDNPNFQPSHSLLVIKAPGGNRLLVVNSAGVVATNQGIGTLDGNIIAVYQMTAAQFKALPTSGYTAAQVCAAAFPENTNGAQSDLIQISYNTQMNKIQGGGGGSLVYRVNYQGSVLLT
jgi:hypothetical protein